MKIDNHFREKYFPIFVEKAAYLIKVSLRISPAEARDLASDFTVSFLYSRSLLVSFDSSKGDIEPFFSSWVRKTLWSYNRGEKQWRTFSELKEWSLESSSFNYFDFKNWFYSIVEVIGGRAWVSGNIEVPYSKVFKAASLQVLTNELCGGKVRYNELARVLGLQPPQAKKAYLSLVELLNDKRSQRLI